MIRIIAAVVIIALCLGCARVPHIKNAKAQPARPQQLDDYYSVGRTYRRHEEMQVVPARHYTLRRIKIYTDSGEVTVDYYQHREKKSPELILVFPVLGGKPVLEAYLADYLARHGYEAVIVQRSEEFKDPKQFDQLEATFRDNVVRDRVALDFFEQQYGKSEFGGLGMSRGAINLATTAGVDPRMKYNVFMLGGTDIAEIFQDSNQNSIKRYVEKVLRKQAIDKTTFRQLIRDRVVTDPLYLTRYVDPKRTLLILALFDQTVPYKHQKRLRKQIGSPETIFLFAEHFTSIAFTQVLKLLPIGEEVCLFPFDYVESETLDFFNRSFKRKSSSWTLLPLKMLQAPLNLLTTLLLDAFDSKPRLVPIPEVVAAARSTAALKK